MHKLSFFDNYNSCSTVEQSGEKWQLITIENYDSHNNLFSYLKNVIKVQREIRKFLKKNKKIKRSSSLKLIVCILFNF